MDLGKGLRTAMAKLTGAKLVDEAAVKEFLRDVQRVLIANDVPVKLVFELSKRIEKSVLGEEQAKGLSLREQVVRSIYDELVALLGERYEPDLKPRRILLLGLYGSGKCVHPDTKIPLPDGSTKTIEEIYQSTDQKQEECDGGFLKNGASLGVFSFDPETLKIKETTCTALWKLKKTDPLISVSIDNGNAEKITTTPEHPFFVLENGEINQRRADQLKLGDSVAVPGKLPYAEKRTELDIIGHLPKSSRIKDMRLALSVRSFLRSKFGTLNSAVLSLGICRPYCQISKELKKGETDAALLVKTIKIGFEPEKPEEWVVVGGRKTVRFPTSLNTDLAEFMGYLYGDGNIDARSIHITNADDEVVRRLGYLGDKLFGMRPTILEEKRSNVNLRRTSFSSKILLSVICGLFGLPRSKKADIMTLPPFFMLASTPARRAFLRAYFDCDGYVEKGTRHVEFCTASPKFAYQLRLLLLADGITSAYSVKKVNGRPYHRVFLRAKEAEKFAEFSGSCIDRKTDRFEKLAEIGVGQTEGKLENLHLGDRLKEVREYFGASIGELQRKVPSYGIYESRGVISKRKLSEFLGAVGSASHTNNSILHACRESTDLDDLRQRTSINTPHLNASIWRLQQQGYLASDDSGELQTTRSGMILLSQNDKFDTYKLEFLRMLCDSDIKWGKVCRLELDDSQAYVYDMTVDGCHNFVANHFIVHNTTTCGKVAQFYKKRGLSAALVCADTDRPAAYQQLQQLGAKCGAPFHGIENEKDVKKILQTHLPLIKEDIVIVDSAGRSGFDEELVKQLKTIVAEVQPQEKILVMSADIGQTAGRQAVEFNTAVGLTGVIITKLDGSGKGGGALAACHVAKVPVLFIGKGEKLEDLEVFDSKKFVGRLLGFPDFEALMEKIKEAGVQEKLEETEMEKLTLGAFYSQLKAARKMGPLSSVFGMMGMNDMPADMMKTSENKLKKYEAIISSMTKYERDNAECLRKQKGRIERVAKGAGCKPEEVRELLSQFEKMANLVNGFKKNRGLRKKLEKMMGKSGMDMNKLQGMMGGG